MAMKKCPVCGVSVKDENLVRHVRNQHPHEKVEGLEELGVAAKKKASPRSWKDDLTRMGAIIAVAGAVWLVLAILFPVPVGIVVPSSPHLIILTLVGVAFLSAGWVLGSPALARSGVKLAAVGLVLGLALGGASALLAAQQGVPTLDPRTTSEPGGWSKANNAAWKVNGLPVVFYFGSAACPFCAASSWAVRGALQQFGSLTGWTLTTSMSNPNEYYRDVPEVDLATAALASSYLTLDVKAGNDNQQITTPPLSAVEQAYVATYDTQRTVPFYVVGGIYIHSTLVEPGTYFPNGVGSPPLTPQQVDQAIASATGPVYQAVHQAQIYLEAYLVKACQAAGVTPPASVSQNPEVAAILAQIT